jgi:hypothetical protein
MLRTCSRCGKVFSPGELSKAASRDAGRETPGPEKVALRFYVCHACGQADVFVDLRPRAGETDAEFHARRAEAESAVRGLNRDGVDVVLVVR